MSPSTTPAPQARRLVDDAGVRLGLGAVAVIAVTMATMLAGVPEGYVFGALLVVTVTASILLPRRLACLLGVTSWAVCDGFVLNRLGRLTFTGESLQMLVTLVGVALLISQVSAGCAREVRRP
ncbi:MAG: hypothetical protein QM572_05995 [Nocardioides sp.]|uniref:hypothetical protein n=1 Tax=Nocardioides sp. TaxID=35761 RepID=UPI0039E48571